MTYLMEREDQDKILDYLNQKGLPFSRYRFIQDNKYGHMKRLGSGGGGSVYAIKSRLDDELAVKIIGFQEPLISDPKVIKNCELEVQTQRDAGKKCREIVQIEDAQVLWLTMDADYNVMDVQESIPDQDQVEGGLCLFILMEKLQPVLTAREGIISRLRSLDEKEIVRFAVDVAKALQAAHTHPKKIIHRDVKPENIFWDEFTGVYKLGDFGIAKGTQYGESLTIGTGTGDYRASEVRKGGVYDVRADIYSYGMTLYKLLDRNWGNQRSYGVDHKLPELSYGSEKLKQIVMKACSYKPEERYASMSEILEALEQLHSEVITDAWLLEEDSLDKKEVPLEEEPAVVELQLTEKYDASSQQKEVLEVVELKKVAEKEIFVEELKKSDDVKATRDWWDEQFENRMKLEEETAKEKPLLKSFYGISAVIGGLALLIAMAGILIVNAEKIMPDMISTKFYVVLMVNVLLYMAYDLMDAFIYNEIILRVIVLLLGFGCFIYYYVSEGFDWIILIPVIGIISLIIDNKKVPFITGLISIISLFVIGLVDKLPTISSSVFWVGALLLLIGIRNCVTYINTKIYISRWELESKMNKVVIISAITVGVAIWLLNMFDVIDLAITVERLHLTGWGYVCLGVVLIGVLFGIRNILCYVAKPPVVEITSYKAEKRNVKSDYSRGISIIVIGVIVWLVDRSSIMNGTVLKDSVQPFVENVVMFLKQLKLIRCGVLYLAFVALDRMICFLLDKRIAISLNVNE